MDQLELGPSRGAPGRRSGDLEVHPLAAIFPMMADDELADLAEDIKANGLIHPVVLDAAGKTVLDGRNRLKACALAGVDPVFERFDGDPRALIVSANLARRNLTKGKQAMALATIYPEPEKGGRGHKKERITETVTLSATRLREARSVLRAGPDDLAPAVLAGTLSLDQAYTDAQRRRNAAQSDEQQMARLRAGAPDLADLVIEGKMTLGEGLAAWNQRQEDRRRAIDAGRRAADSILDLCTTAVTIYAAAELGERDLIADEQIIRLDEAMSLLRRVAKNDLGGKQ